MSDSWQSSTQMADRHNQQGGLFVRLSGDGEKVVGAFCGEPFPREVFWNGERYETYDDKNPAHEDKRPSFRVALNFYVPAENAMKVIEGGARWFKDVLKVREKYGLEHWLFEIERHGDAKDPKTRYSILPDQKIDDALRARMEQSPLHDLESVVSGGASTSDSEFQDGSPPTVDAATAAELVKGLKALPRSDVEAFLAEFRLRRVRDLAMRDVPAARAAIERLLTKHAPQESRVEIDPFA